MSVTIDGFSEHDTAELGFVFEHLEGSHADTVLFVASQQRVDDRAAWEEAAFAAIDPTGVAFRLTAPGEECVERIDFDAAASSLLELQGQFFGLLVRARQAFPNDPVSSLEEEFELSTTLRTRIGTVVRTEQITPNFVEVTVGGMEGLADLGGDEFFYVMVPTTPDAIPEGALMSEIEQMPEGTFDGASYTTRRRRPDAGEIDLWILLHGHDGGVSGWAASTRPGDTVALWGPRRSYEPPSDTAAHLLVCDETGLPAACAIIEALPDDHPITLIAESVDAAHRPPMPSHPALTTRWLDRVDRTDRTDGEGPLLATVRELDLPPSGLYAFGAAESREISAVRRYLRDELDMSAEQVHMTGYWRR